MYGLDSNFRETYGDIAERNEQVLNEVYGNPKHNLTKRVKEAAEQHERFYEKHNLGMKLISAAEESIQQLVTYFESVDFEKVNKRGDLLYQPKDVINNMQNLGRAIQSVADLKKSVSKDMSTGTTKIRGSVEKTKYNS